jgi:hypothetical protein
MSDAEADLETLRYPGGRGRGPSRYFFSSFASAS